MKEAIDTTYLKPGDHQRIADAMDVSRGTVSMVAGGFAKSAHVKRAIIAMNEERRVQEQTRIAQLCASIKEESVTDFNQAQ